MKATVFDIAILEVVLVIVTLLLSGIITGNTFFNVFTNANSASGNVAKERFEIEDIQLQQNKVRF